MKVFYAKKGSVWAPKMVGSIEEGMRLLDQNLSYTARSVTITDENDRVVAERKWLLCPKEEAPSNAKYLCDGCYLDWEVKDND